VDDYREYGKGYNLEEEETKNLGYRKETLASSKTIVRSVLEKRKFTPGD
jgi:hypothetical protein